MDGWKELDGGAADKSEQFPQNTLVYVFRVFLFSTKICSNV